MHQNRWWHFHLRRALLAAQDAAIAALKVGNVLGGARAAAVQTLKVCLLELIHSSPACTRWDPA